MLAVPLTAFTNESGEVVHLARRSNDTLNSDMLGAGTPPPSYAEVLAYISTESIDQSGAVLVNPGKSILLIFTLGIISDIRRHKNGTRNESDR